LLQEQEEKLADLDALSAEIAAASPSSPDPALSSANATSPADPPSLTAQDAQDLRDAFEAALKVVESAMSNQMPDRHKYGVEFVTYRYISAPIPMRQMKYLSPSSPVPRLLHAFHCVDARARAHLPLCSGRWTALPSAR
jgi:hypothetical protein